MKVVFALIVLCCALWEAAGYPAYYPYYGSTYDSLSFGTSDSSRGGMALSRYYSPYLSPAGGGMAAFMFKPQAPDAMAHYLVPDRRRQTQPDFYVPPQQNEVYPPPPQAPEVPQLPQLPEQPAATEQTELADPTERVDKVEDKPTTAKSVPELTEPEVEQVDEPVQTPKKRVSKKKQAKRPVEDEEEEEYEPKMPAAFFPMFFGYGGRAGGGAPAGATAIANAYSTGRGGVASSHATAYGAPRPDAKLYN